MLFTSEAEHFQIFSAQFSCSIGFWANKALKYLDNKQKDAEHKKNYFGSLWHEVKNKAALGSDQV